jgi:hypothetical protein
VAFFDDEDEVYTYIGGAIRTALDHPQVGPRLSKVNLVVQMYLTEPTAALTVRMVDPMTVEDRGVDPVADVRLYMSSDIADRFWRGEYNLAVGLKRGRIQVDGDVEGFLAILPEVKPLFPRYRAMIARKDRGQR